MPKHTDVRITQLCARAKAATTEGEVKSVLEELRAALAEHIGLARESLEAQIAALTALEAKTKENEVGPNSNTPNAA